MCDINGNKHRNKALEKVYGKMIDDLTDKHMIQAYREALECSEEIYLSMLKTMREKIDEQIKRMTKKGENEDSK